MKKFCYASKFSLDFLGKDWKDAFLEFDGLSIKEIRELIDGNIDKKDPSVIMKESLELVKRQFIKGMAPGKNGDLKKVEKEDIEELPKQVLDKAFVFLVQG